MLPKNKTLFKNALKAAGEVVQKGFKPATPEEQERRLKICHACEFFRKSDNRCGKCGCFLQWKSRMRAWSCPVDKW